MILTRLSVVFSVALSGAAAILPRTIVPNKHSAILIPAEYTYLLPNGFSGNANYTFANGTHTSNSSVNDLLQSTANAPLIAYDQEFLDITGPSPDIKLVQDRTAEYDLFAFEAGVWVPELDEIWFTSSVYQQSIRPAMVYRFHLASGTVKPLVGKNGNVTNPNGGYYFERKVYFTTFENQDGSYSGGIVSVDVHTLEIRTVLNS